MTRARLALLAGVAGAIAIAFAFARVPQQAAFAYLAAWAFAMAIALGSLIFLMIGHAMRARWTVLYQRYTEAIVGALPVLAILFVPIAAAAPHLYPWLHAPPADPELAARAVHRAAYLNEPFWCVRAAIFLVFWVIVGERMRRRPSPALASALFIPVGVTLTFAAFDWLMSLEPDWISTIYGLIYFAAGIVGALSLIALVGRRAGRDAQAGALSRVIFGFLIFWVYVEFAQGFIIWIANKPDEVPWYVVRGEDGWGSVLIVLAVGGFAAPFLALLPRGPSRNPTWVAIVGGWLVAMQYLDVYWLVRPALHGAPAFAWPDVAAPVAVLGLAGATALARLKPPLPDDDPRRVSAITYRGN